MLGGFGAPTAPNPAALSTSSSRHLVTAATGAIATERGATEPVPAAGTGGRAGASSCWAAGRGQGGRVTGGGVT